MSVVKSMKFKKFHSLSEGDQEDIESISCETHTLRKISKDLKAAELFITCIAKDEDTLWAYYDTITPRWWKGEGVRIKITRDKFMIDMDETKYEGTLVFVPK